MNVVGPSDLTVDAVARHEAEHADHEHNSGCCADIDGHSIGGFSAAKTNCTWMSQWTNCTNVTFGKVMRRFSLSNSAQHKEVCCTLHSRITCEHAFITVHTNLICWCWHCLVNVIVHLSWADTKIAYCRSGQSNTEIMLCNGSSVSRPIAQKDQIFSMWWNSMSTYESPYANVSGFLYIGVDACILLIWIICCQLWLADMVFCF
jgi:hypothetical protein